MLVGMFMVLTFAVDKALLNML